MFQYAPPPRLSNGHGMTLYAWARPRHFPALPPPVARYFDVAPDARVMAHCHWHPAPRRHPTLMALHGLEGSSEAPYMRGMADKAYRAGLNVVRVNQRNCGGTERLSRGLYHSGLSADPAAIIRELIEVDGLRSIAVAGYSLGGNLALKLAGDYGGNAPRELVAVCAVSPTMDLARCVDALERGENLLYEWNFVRNLKRRMSRKARVWPGLFDVSDLRAVRTVRQFDEQFTAPHHGFRDAADYYFRASSLRVVDRITIPALILSAEDDPFVPADQFRHPAVAGNPNVTVVLTRHGGHCGFVAPSQNGFDGYWAEQAVVEFIKKETEDRRQETGENQMLP